MVETLLECPQQSSKHQNKQKSIFLKSSQVSKVIKLPLSLPSEKNHVKMQVLKSVPPEHKQPKHRGLLPFPTDQICRQIQRKFLGDNSHHYQARHCTADNHSLLRAEEYTKHPPIRLNGQSNQSPSCSTTAWINGIPCPRQTQMPRHEQTLNLCAQGFPKAGLWKGQLSPGVSGWDLRSQQDTRVPVSRSAHRSHWPCPFPSCFRQELILSLRGEFAAHQLLESGYLGLQEYGCQSKRDGKEG